MTTKVFDSLVNHLCDADAEEQLAVEAVRKAANNLAEARRKRHGLASRVGAVLEANPKVPFIRGREWDRSTFKHRDRIVYLDEHGCVVVAKPPEEYSLVIPAEAVATSPDDEILDEYGDVKPELAAEAAKALGDIKAAEAVVDWPDTFGLNDDSLALLDQEVA